MNTPKGPKDVEDHNRMIFAVVLSLLVLLGYEYFGPKPPVIEPPQVTAQTARIDAAATPATVKAPAVQSRAKVISAAKRISVQGLKLSGTISLKGARLDDVQLNDRYKTVAREENVSLLNPSGTKGVFYTESGWLVGDQATSVPDANTVWKKTQNSASVLESDGAPVILQWNNGQGVLFERSITLDANYLFTVTQRLVNKTNKSLSMTPYHLLSRTGLPSDYRGTYIQQEGPLSYLNDDFEEYSYKEIAAKGEKVDESNVAGWMGISDKYWLVALLPPAQEMVTARLAGNGGAAVPHIQADIVHQTLNVNPGTEISNVMSFYVGVKDLDVMQSYETVHGFENLSLGIDFGIWSFITKPFYSLLHLLLGWFGHIGLAIIGLTVIVRGALFPLATKSYVSMAKMKVVMPKLRELQEKYKDDKVKMQMEIMELYKRENANPFSGCWPMVVQIPIFFALYKVIMISVALRHAPFWGWIDDLSAPDPTSFLNVFGLIPWTPPEMLQIGAWPILFCLSMVIQKRLSPPMPDKMQEKIQSYFPYFITLMLANFSVGLVIYWTWSNTLAVLQQYYILKKHGGEDVSLLRGHHKRRKPRKKKKEGEAVKKDKPKKKAQPKKTSPKKSK